MLKINNWVKIILDSLYDGILIINIKGIVVYINPSYTRITNVQPVDILGKVLKEIRPGSRLTDLMNLGKVELGVHRKEADAEYIVNMAPIYIKELIVGGVSVVNEVTDVYKLSEKIKYTKKIIESLSAQVKSSENGKYNFDDIIAVDENSEITKKFAMRISKNDSNILIEGESGTGKELFASSIHNESTRRYKPFIVINSASFQKELMESELFGYESGSFTGAQKGGKIGLFELANKGTLFLDEISELDYSLQGKLLRVLQEKTIRKVGGTKEREIDVRLICATNKNLEEMVKKGKFREDLYYRIAIIPLKISPLRLRKKDIPTLVDKFLNELSNKYYKKVNISKEALSILINYNWPGNIRELRNVIEFTYNMVKNKTIEVCDIPEGIKETSYLNFEVNNDIMKLSDFIKIKEKAYIHSIISKFGDNTEGKKKAAEILGISLASLYNKLK